jgi:hypothetical protein
MGIDQKIWFVQVKRRTIETDFTLDDCRILGIILLTLLSQQDTEPLAEGTLSDEEVVRARYLEWIGNDNRVNRRCFANSRDDRNFLAQDARIRR